MVNFPNVEVSNFPEVDDIDKGIIEKNFQSFLQKVSYEGITPRLHVNVKEYEKGGIKKQHEVHARLDLDGELFVASDTDWQLIATIQAVLNKLEKEVLKKHSKK